MAAKMKQSKNLKESAKHPVSLMKWLGVGSSIGLLIAGAVFVVMQATRADVFPIQEVRFVGEFDKVDVSALKAIVEKNIDGNFFTLDVGRIHQLVTNLPWVNFAWIDRKWPGILQVRVVEEKAVAIWRNETLLNMQGESFVAGTAEEFFDLPVLFGESANEKALMDVYKVMHAIVQPAGLSVSHLSIDARHAIKAVLDDSIELFLGRNDFEKKLTRFIRVYGSNFAHIKQKISRIDLRYSNGFSLFEKKTPSISQIQQTGVPSV